MNGQHTVFIVLLLSFLLFPSLATAAEWVPAGSDHPEFRIIDVAVSGDGKILVAGGDGICVMHNNGTVLATRRSGNYVNEVAVTTDGSRIAGCGRR